jgi:hypothetical protein
MIYRHKIFKTKRKEYKRVNRHACIHEKIKKYSKQKERNIKHLKRKTKRKGYIFC